MTDGERAQLDYFRAEVTMLRSALAQEERIRARVTKLAVTVLLASGVILALVSLR